MNRARTVCVAAKVVKAPDAPRVVRGTCFVTKDVRSAGLKGSLFKRQF